MHTDPYGVLKENEIHFKTSEPITDPVSGAQIDTIVGEVLVCQGKPKFMALLKLSYRSGGTQQDFLLMYKR